ncbi:hypothetical protein [Amycolatopsis sp. NPDC001319]|uniref:hypothetical protein n=1 Tax=unclassified Amycolatopsis TaxID=2618356 RepID=UPI003689D852
MSSLFSRIRNSINRHGRYTARLDDGRVISTDSPVEMLNLFADTVRQTGFGPRTTDFDGRHNADELEALEHLFTDARPEPGTPAEAEWAGAVARYLDTSGNYRQTGGTAAEPAGRTDEATAGFEWGMFAREAMPQSVIDAYRQLSEQRGTPVDVEAVRTAIDAELREHELRRAQAEMTHPDDPAYDDLVAEAAWRQDNQGMSLAEFVEDWRAATHDVGEADVNDAWGPGDPSPVSDLPERAPAPGSWIARNLQSEPNLVAGQAIDRYRELRAAGMDEASALAQIGPERSLAGQAAIGFAYMSGNGFDEAEARVQAVHDAVLAEAVEQGREISRESAPTERVPRPEWMDELEQAATRVVAERLHDQAVLRDLDAAAEPDPARRAELEVEARALAERAEAFTSWAAERGQSNDAMRELEIQHAVDGVRDLARTATLDTADGLDPVDEQDQGMPEPSRGREDDVETVVIDPTNLMPAVDALRNYGIADAAITAYDEQRASGLDDDTALQTVLAMQDSTDRDLAADTIRQWRDALDAGMEPEAARSHAVVEAADRATPRISAEQAAAVAAAFAAPVSDAAATAPQAAEEFVGEADVNDAAWRFAGVDDADWRWNPAASSLVPEREPEPGSWIARHLPATPVLAVADDYEPDVLTPEEDESEQLDYDAGEEGTRPYTGMAEPMVVNQSGVLRNWDAEATDTFEDAGPAARSAEPWVAEYWAAVHAELDRVAPAGTPERARAVWAEATEISNHVLSCTLPSHQCETCDANDHSDGVFWETEVPAARRLIHDEAPTSQPDAVGSDTADVLDRIDDVLAEPEPAPLAEVVEQCGRAVDDAADAMRRCEAVAEDTDRAERLARWSVEDASERTDESTEGWERA